MTERPPHASIEEIDASSARAPALLDGVLGQMIRAHGKFERQYGYGYVHQMMAWARRYRNGRGLYSVRLGSESRFIFPLGDEYWSEMLLFRGHYESELAWLLHRATTLPYMMFDCGANMGYWSVLASSVAFGGHPVVAIEAARGNVELLAINARANNERFRILHRAVAPTSGMIVKLWGSAHVSHSLRDDWLPDSKDRYEQVETISLDDVAAHYLPERNRPILIKLDVEGAEAEAMIGARRLIGEGALVVYEDHGIETTHAATRHVLSIGGMQIWTRGLDGQLIRLDNIEQVAAVKSDRNLGYNFFAYRDGSPWARVFQ